MFDVTVSIISFNTNRLLERCLLSIFRQTKGIRFQVIVVDNGSLDGSPEMVRKKFSQAILIENSKNYYFSKANNQSLKIARGRYFLLLNSDTYFVDNSISKLISFLDKEKKVGACEGLELYEDGRVVPTGSLFSTPLIDFYELSIIGTRIKDKSLIDKYRMKDENRKDTYEIDVGCDAFLMVRTDLLRKIGGYDERMLLYYTENDLCNRIKRKNFSVVHYGSAKVMHTVSASAEKLGWRKNDIYYDDLLAYYKKHGYGVWGTALYFLLKIEEAALKILKK